MNWVTPYGDALLPTVALALINTALLCAGSAIISFVVGVTVAVIWIAARPWLAEVIRSSANVMDGIGAILPALALSTSLNLTSEWSAAILVGLLNWNILATFVREEWALLARAPYIDSAKVIGASTWRLLVSHALPHILPRLVPLMVGLFANCAGLLGALGFLGMAGNAKQSLGFMVFDAKSYVHQSPTYFLASFIGMVLLIIVPHITASLLRLESPRKKKHRSQ